MYKNIKVNIANWIFAFSLFMATDTYLTWFSSFYSIFRYLLLILLIICIANKDYNKHNIGISLGFLILFLWNSMASGSSLFSIILTLSTPFLLLIPLNKRLEVLGVFVHKLFPFFLFLSCISYLLWLAGFLHLPGSYIPPVNELKSYDYTSYFFFLIPNDTLQAGRFLSYYDEPGVLGTITAVILFYYRKSLSVFPKIVYFVTGFLSLSFFFIAVVTFLLFISEIGLKKRFLICVVIFAFVIFAFSFFDNDYLQTALFNRFLIEDGHLIGNTRNVGDFGDYFWGKFIFSGDLLFGTTDKVDMSQGSCSIHRSIYIQGLLFVLYAIFLYLHFFFKKKKLDKAFFADILVWLLLTYQRPSFTVFFYFFFFTTYFESLKIKTNNIPEEELLRVK